MKFEISTKILPFFFENGSLRQTIFKNTFWLTLGTGISKALNLVLMIYVARLLGAFEYGKFTFALAFVSLFTVIADLGISVIFVREFAKDREKEKEKEFYSLISLKAILGSFMVALAILGSFFITGDPVVRRIILILAFFSLANSFIDSIYALFQSRQKMEHQAGAAILGAVLTTILGFAALLMLPSAETLSLAFLTANLITLVLVVLFLNFKVFPLKIAWERKIWKKFLSMSWPLAFTSFFGLLYTYIDSVMLGYFNQIQETGWYNAAYRIAWMGYIVMGLAVTSFYPILSSYFEKSKEKLQQAWNYQMDLMMAFAFPLMVGSIILAPRIIDFFYGAEFASSVLAFQILMVMAGILLLYAPFQQMLIVANQQIKLIWATLAGAILNVVLNFYLIPKYSLYGSAVATVITQALIFILFFIFTLRCTPLKFSYFRFLMVMAGIMVSSSVMALVISNPSVYYLNVVFSIIIGIIVYFGVFVALRFLAKRFLMFSPQPETKIN